MFRVKISVPTNLFSQNIRKAIDAAMALRVHGVQINLWNEVRPAEYGETARRQLLHYLNERELQLASTHFPLRNPLTASERLDERIAALREAIEFSGKLRVRTLTLRAGRIPPRDDTETYSLLYQLLSDLASCGNRHGVQLCLIPCGDSPEELRTLIDSIQTGPVGVDADLAVWVMNGQPVTSQLRSLHSLVGHFEIRDAIRDVDGHGREVAVGRGEIDWDEVAALIGEMEYAGWLNVDRQEGQDRSGDAGRAVAYLRQVLRL